MTARKKTTAEKFRMKAEREGVTFETLPESERVLPPAAADDPNLSRHSLGEIHAHRVAEDASRPERDDALARKAEADAAERRREKERAEKDRAHTARVLPQGAMDQYGNRYPRTR